VEERGGESEDTGFLPPEPAGPEPELGGRPPQTQATGAEPGGAQAAGAQPPGAQPPGAHAAGAQPPGTHPPPPGYWYAPAPGQAQPPPGQAPPPGYGYPTQTAPPPGYGYGYPPPPPGQAYPPPWGYPQPAQPDNGSAVAGFVLSLVSGGLLVISFGMSSIISLAAAICGVVYSRKGKKKVEAGETTKHAGLAKAGFVISWISLGLSIIATLAYGLLVVLLIVSESFRDDFNNDFNNGQTITATAAIAVRAAARLFGA
jgi:hypothetical protein